MDREQYTKEQQKDIEERVVKGLATLKDLGLFPSAIVQKVNIGDNMFADKVICYLQDSKFTPVTSPIQDVDKED